MESDANYHNDTIANADEVELSLPNEEGERTALVAGTIWADGNQQDEDLYRLGQLDAGNTVVLDAESLWPATLDRDVVPWTRVFDSQGNVVPDIDENPLDGKFEGRISKTETYYAEVRSVRSYEVYEGNAYVFSDSPQQQGVQRLTWEDAETRTQALGGHLVTINDQAEQDWLNETFFLRTTPSGLGCRMSPKRVRCLVQRRCDRHVSQLAGRRPADNTEEADFAYLHSNGTWYSVQRRDGVGGVDRD